MDRKRPHGGDEADTLDPPRRETARSGSREGAGDDDSGNLTGPESPAGAAAARDAAGEGQGDDLANRLGGGDRGGGPVSEGGAASGDLDAEDSAPDEPAPPARGIGDDAGGPGGMGGARAAGGTGLGRPPGGVSPIDRDEAGRDQERGTVEE